MTSEGKFEDEKRRIHPMGTAEMVHIRLIRQCKAELYKAYYLRSGLIDVIREWFGNEEKS